MAGETILVVEDEPDIRKLIAYNLRLYGFKVHGVSSGEEAITSAVNGPPDAIILDLMLPGIDGFEVCRRLRDVRHLRSVPIIMLTAKSEDTDVISGLDVGADDYVMKPFSSKVLIARLRAVLRRTPPAQVEDKETITFDGIEIDVRRHSVSRDGTLVDLSATEFRILSFFMRNPGWVFTRSQIISAVNGEDYPVTERSVDVHIVGLRKKLGTKGSCITTVRGVGYKMEKDIPT